MRRDTIRLIATTRLPAKILLPLAANQAALNDLADLQNATNGRPRASATRQPGIDPRQSVFGRPGRSFVDAAFAHTRPGGNRFNGDDGGAWYCAFDAATCLSEVSYHLTRELTAIGRFDNTTDYAELVANVLAPFHDLRSADPAEEPALHPDPRVAYPAGQALAFRLRQEAHSNGIVYPSVRHRRGICLVAFRPELILNLRQGGYWRLEWQGSATPRITPRSR